MAALSSKEATAYLIDPLNAPEPSAETGPGSHFGSTFAPNATRSAEGSHERKTSSSKNPFRDPSRRMTPPPNKSGVSTSSRPVSLGSPRQLPNYRSEAFGEGPPSYDAATSPNRSPKAHGHHRRTSSLKERFPGDESHKPLDIIRRDSKKAARSPHLAKRHLPGADLIDKLDPAFGGRAYHHEGPYDAALLARNTSYENSPVAALESSNAEAIKATPAENVKDAVERHVPLDGVAIVPPGMQDRFGRTYNYEEGADLMHEMNNTEPGFSRYVDKDYDKDDLKGESEPSFSLDRALRLHKIDDNGIEMQDSTTIDREYHRAERDGTLDTRDPIAIAGNESKYIELELKNGKDYDSDLRHADSLRQTASGLKKRFGSLRKKMHHDD